MRFDVAPGARVVLGAGVVLGDRCRFHVGSGEVSIGAGTTLGERCVVTAHERVAIGARCLLGDEVVLIDLDHRFDDVERPVRLQGVRTGPVTVGDGVRIGPGAAVLRGARADPHTVADRHRPRPARPAGAHQTSSNRDDLVAQQAARADRHALVGGHDAALAEGRAGADRDLARTHMEAAAIPDTTPAPGATRAPAPRQSARPSPVVSINSSGIRKRIVTPSARLRASHIVLAGNVHLGAPLRRLSETLLPVWRYAAVTEPLGERLGEVIAFRGSVADSDGIDHFRIVDGDRLMWASPETTWDARPSRFGTAIARRIAAIYPGLGKVAILRRCSAARSG